MNVPTNLPNNVWNQAVTLMLTASMGAAVALICTSRHKSPAAQPVTPPAQVMALPLFSKKIHQERIQHTGRALVITPMVKAALLKDEILYPSTNPSLNTINVDTDNDGETLVLKGTVRTEGMKNRAAQIAQNTLVGTSYKLNNQLAVATY